MLYQPLLLGEKTYAVSGGNIHDYPLHRHPEWEISYCVSGSYTFLTGDGEVLLHAGEGIAIPSMHPHGIRKNSDEEGEYLTVEAGAAFLGSETVRLLREKTFLSGTDAPTREICGYLAEIDRVRREKPPFSDLLLRGAIYRVSAALLTYAGCLPGKNENRLCLTSLSTAEYALDAVRERFAEPLSVADMAAETGYGKSSFCKIFREITGRTFHQVLNAHRIGVAKYYLTATDEPIERIAERVGLGNAKTFCRVFRESEGITPGSYRRAGK